MKTNADLRQFQRTMAAALMQPLTRADGLRPETCADFVKPNDRMTSFERLEIYARQYWFRLLDCLYDDYPALRVLLGESRFHKLSRDYLEAHPSTSWTLRNLGSQLPQFLADDPKARDVARVEWAQTLAFDEPWQNPLQLKDLDGADPGTLRLGLQPCVVLVQVDHAVDNFITATKKASAEVRGSASQAVMNVPTRAAVVRRPVLRREPVHLVIHRNDNSLYFKRLTPEAFQLLAALRDGLNLIEALDLTQAQAGQVRDWFADFAQLGWLTSRP